MSDTTVIPYFLSIFFVFIETEAMRPAVRSVDTIFHKSGLADFPRAATRDVICKQTKRFIRDLTECKHYRIAFLNGLIVN